MSYAATILYSDLGFVQNTHSSSYIHSKSRELEYNGRMKEAELERQLKMLANRRRLAILDLLRRKREMSVSDIAEAIRLSFTSTSKHLTMLERAGFVEKEQRSLNVFYRIAAPPPKLYTAVFSTF